MASCIAKEALDNQSVGMGQIALAKAPGRLNAVLGSCVGVALYHQRSQIGALAHVVLPQSNGRAANPGKFADTAIPHMLQLLAKQGVTAGGLTAVLAGGACMFGAGGPLQIGEANAAAIAGALQAANIRVIARDLGGTKGRRMTLDCRTGAVTVDIVGSGTRTL